MFQPLSPTHSAFSKCLLLFCLVVLIPACAYDSEEDLFPGGDECDTSNVSYTQDVLPILVNNCYVCHDNANRQGGIVLEGYDQLKVQVDNGRLVGAIRRNPGFSPMPQGAPALPDCFVDQIAQWVTDGALDN